MSDSPRVFHDGDWAGLDSGSLGADAVSSSQPGPAESLVGTAYFYGLEVSGEVRSRRVVRMKCKDFGGPI